MACGRENSEISNIRPSGKKCFREVENQISFFENFIFWMGQENQKLFAYIISCQFANTKTWFDMNDVMFVAQAGKKRLLIHLKSHPDPYTQPPGTHPGKTYNFCNTYEKSIFYHLNLEPSFLVSKKIESTILIISISYE